MMPLGTASLLCHYGVTTVSLLCHYGVTTLSLHCHCTIEHSCTAPTLTPTLTPNPHLHPYTLTPTHPTQLPLTLAARAVSLSSPRSTLSATKFSTASFSAKVRNRTLGVEGEGREGA